MSSAIATSEAKISSGLAQLIEEVRAAVRSGSNAAETGEAVAKLLQPHLSARDFLTDEQMTPDACAYCRHHLHVEPDGSFSIVALVWLPGQETKIHDHVSWCVVGVYRGEEDETTYQLGGNETDRHLLVTGHAVNEVGSVCALVPPGDIHRVKNSGQDTAVSLHVYGADVQARGSSILRCYDHEVRSRPTSATTQLA